MNYQLKWKQSVWEDLRNDGRNYMVSITGITRHDDDDGGGGGGEAAAMVMPPSKISYQLPQ